MPVGAPSAAGRIAGAIVAAVMRVGGTACWEASRPRGRGPVDRRWRLDVGHHSTVTGSVVSKVRGIAGMN